MTVAFVGNMNNNHFAMARFLRERGVDAEVLLFDNDPDHFQPTADSYDDSYEAYCRTLSWGTPANWLRTSPATIARDLERYDVLIGCGLAPAFASRARRRLDVFVPYGADLHHFTRYRLTYPNRVPGTWAAVSYQRRAIPECRVFHMDATNEIYERRWQELRGGSERWTCGVPMVYTGIYSPEHIQQVAHRTRWAGAFAAIRAQSDLLLFSHVRHFWGGAPGHPGEKGTSQLLQALAMFRQRHPGVRVKLITFEYGPSVARSKETIARLGLDGVVSWFPKGLRKDLMVGIAQADIVCGEFQHSWLSGGVVYEALAMEKPLLGMRRDELYQHLYPDLYPMMNAHTPSEICAALEAYLADPGAFKAMGEQGRRWYQQRVVEPVIDRYVEHLERLRPASRRPAAMVG